MVLKFLCKNTIFFELSGVVFCKNLLESFASSAVFIVSLRAKKIK